MESSFWEDFNLCFSIQGAAFRGCKVRTFRVYLDLLPAL